jgi:hypothetical protein
MVLGNIPESPGNDERRSKICKGVLELPETRMSLLDAEEPLSPWN